jgi:hypothetical protein
MLLAQARTASTPVYARRRDLQITFVIPSGITLAS